jgi:hypothetical protein
LSIRDPGNREYKLELATYCSNLAALLHDRQQFAAADRWSRRALDLIEGLARVAPSLAVARADAHSLRGMILEPQNALDAEREYAAAVDLFDQLHNDQNLIRLPAFLQRFGDLLINLAVFPHDPADAGRARQLLTRAVGLYVEVGTRIAASGSKADARSVLDNLSRILPELPEPERGRLTAASEQLQRILDEGGASR